MSTHFNEISKLNCIDQVILVTMYVNLCVTCKLHYSGENIDSGTSAPTETDSRLPRFNCCRLQKRMTAVVWWRNLNGTTLHWPLSHNSVVTATLTSAYIYVICLTTIELKLIILFINYNYNNYIRSLTYQTKDGKNSCQFKQGRFLVV